MELLTSQQAAEYLGVGIATLRRDLAAGRIAPDVHNPRLILFSRATLDRWKKQARPPVGYPKGRPRTKATD